MSIEFQARAPLLSSTISLFSLFLCPLLVLVWPTFPKLSWRPILRYVLRTPASSPLSPLSPTARASNASLPFAMWCSNASFSSLRAAYVWRGFSVISGLPPFIAFSRPTVYQRLSASFSPDQHSLSAAIHCFFSASFLALDNLLDQPLCCTRLANLLLRPSGIHGQPPFIVNFRQYARLRLSNFFSCQLPANINLNPLHDIR